MVDMIWTIWQECHGAWDPDVANITSVDHFLTYTNITIRQRWTPDAYYEHDLFTASSFAPYCNLTT
eukprot:12525-Eustigmatos_ZCMA.PRE.1